MPKLTYSPIYICYVCGTDKSLPHWYRHYDEGGIFDRKYLCSKCYYDSLYPNREILREQYIINKPENICNMCGNNITTGNWYTHSVTGLYPMCKSCYDMHDPGSNANIIKSMAKSRNKELGKNTTRGKGFRAEQGILCTIGAENCNTKYNNFNHKIDGYQYGGDKRIQIKSGALEFGDGIKYYEWKFEEIKLENCDTVYLACMDKIYSKYLKILKIPVDYIKSIGIRYIRINPNTVKKYQWNKYDINVKLFNNIYDGLSIDNCAVLKGDNNEI